MITYWPFNMNDASIDCGLEIGLKADTICAGHSSDVFVQIIHPSTGIIRILCPFRHKENTHLKQN